MSSADQPGPDPNDGSTDSPSAPPASPPPRRGRLRPLLWLTTLSTVVAVATGMFTLGDQLFPNAEGAPADQYQYRQSVDAVCAALSTDQGNLASTTTDLADRLNAATTPGAQQDALIDYTNGILAPSENELGKFMGVGLPAPTRALTAYAQDAVAAWTRIDGRLRRYRDRLKSAAGESQLVAAVDTLTATGDADETDAVELTADLTRLSPAGCILTQPSPPPAVKLPALGGSGSGSPSSGAYATPTPVNLPLVATAPEAIRPGKPPALPVLQKHIPTTPGGTTPPNGTTTPTTTTPVTTTPVTTTPVTTTPVTTTPVDTTTPGRPVLPARLGD
jgi:hypothetical protein